MMWNNCCGESRQRCQWYGWVLTARFVVGNAVSGISDDLHIYAVFVSKSSGEALLHYAGDMRTICYIMPAFENVAWSVMAVSFISLIGVSIVLATFVFVRRYRFRYLPPQLLLAREPSGMSSTEVKALPSFVFKCVGEGRGTAETCAICLEDYEAGENLRLLPCHHGKCSLSHPHSL